MDKPLGAPALLEHTQIPTPPLPFWLYRGQFDAALAPSWHLIKRYRWPSGGLFGKKTMHTRCRALPGDDGEVRGAHAGPHEEHHVLVPRLPVGHHLPLEGLQLVLVVPLDVDEADGHLPVPAAVEDLPEAALADELADLQLLEGDVPLLEEDAGLAGLAGEVAGGEEREVHLLKVVLRLLRLLGAFLVLQEWGQGGDRVWVPAPTCHPWVLDGAAPCNVTQIGELLLRGCSPCAKFSVHLIHFHCI